MLSEAKKNLLFIVERYESSINYEPLDQNHTAHKVAKYLLDENPKENFLG